MYTVENPTIGRPSSFTCTIGGQAKDLTNVVVTAKEGKQAVFDSYDIVKYSATIDISDVSCGWHYLTIRVDGFSLYNPTGEMGFLTENVTGSASVHLLVELKKPTISVLSPKNETYMATEVPLNFNVSELAN
jgi:hypothetical protein